jgi:hypothetical protein
MIVPHGSCVRKETINRNIYPPDIEVAWFSVTSLSDSYNIALSSEKFSHSHENEKDLFWIFSSYPCDTKKDN